MDLVEALRALGPGAALSHHDAARAHGIELLDDDGSHHATVPRNSSRARLAGWSVHRRNATTLVTDAGVLVTGPLQTVADLCLVLTLLAAVAAADSAIRQGLVGLAELQTRLRSARGPGAPVLRRVADLVDPVAGSVLESALRVLLLEAGLAAPLTQYVVRDEDGDFVARVDFCWPDARLVVEADGFAYHSDREAYRSDRRRMNELERLGWRVLRFTYEDVMSRPDHVIDLVRECLAA